MAPLAAWWVIEEDEPSQQTGNPRGSVMSPLAGPGSVFPTSLGALGLGCLPSDLETLGQSHNSPTNYSWGPEDRMGLIKLGAQGSERSWISFIRLVIVTGMAVPS